MCNITNNWDLCPYRYKINPLSTTQICLYARLSPKCPFTVSILTPKAQGNSFKWEEPETVSLSRSSDFFLIIPAITLEAGSYIVQMTLKECQQNFQQEKDQTWKLDIAPNREEKECPVVVDDTKIMFVQVITLIDFM